MQLKRSTIGIGFCTKTFFPNLLENVGWGIYIMS